MRACPWTSLCSPTTTLRSRPAARHRCRDTLTLALDHLATTKAPLKAESRAALMRERSCPLRRALDAQGLVDMTDRKLAVERAVGRSVDSLRDLSAVEVRAVLAHFAAMPGSDSESGSQNSSWDERDHDTWIDRLSPPLLGRPHL
ncbi:hypothetical protein GCM10027270_35410 [Nocardioides ginkgobilobae]